MNKQELQNEINKTKEHLANIEKMLAECKYERWKPEHSKEYWIVDSWGIIYNRTWTNSNSDQKRYNFYNCFQTREQAEAEAEKILVRRMLEDIARRLNKGKEIDWENSTQYKYYLIFDNDFLHINYGCSATTIQQGTVYCLDENFKDVAIQEIGEERLKKYLRGE